MCWWCADWGVAPLWFGVLVRWCVGVHVWVLPHGGLVVLVCWWCDARVLHRCVVAVWGVAPIQGWRVGGVVCWCPCMCVHEGVVAPLWFGGVGVLVV